MSHGCSQSLDRLSGFKHQPKSSRGRRREGKKRQQGGSLSLTGKGPEVPGKQDASPALSERKSRLINRDGPGEGYLLVLKIILQEDLPEDS